MKLATHNTMSYLPPKQWFLRPLSFLGRCQGIDYQKQYEKGSRAFDLRLYFDKDDNPEFKHGIFKYSAEDLYDVLRFADSHQMAVRVLLEIRGKFDRNNEEHRSQAISFYLLCLRFQCTYHNVRLFGGRTTGDGTLIYPFGYSNEPNLIHKYSSTTSFFKSDNRFLRIIDDWCPWLYARLHNRKNIKEYLEGNDTPGYLYIDFINIQ